MIRRATVTSSWRYRERIEQLASHALGNGSGQCLLQGAPGQFSCRSGLPGRQLQSEHVLRRYAMEQQVRVFVNDRRELLHQPLAGANLDEQVPPHGLRVSAPAANHREYVQSRAGLGGGRHPEEPAQADEVGCHFATPRVR